MSENLNKTDAELSQELAVLQKKSLIAKILLFGCFAGSMACMFFDFLPGVVVCVIALIVAGKHNQTVSNQIKESAGNGILLQALNDVFEDVDYRPFEKLNSFEIDNAGFGFCYDEMRGNDLMFATYKGLNIAMSDVELVDISTDSDGHRTESTVFKGLWMICDFGKELSADVQVCERSKLGQKIAKGGIKTENEAFNKQFKIESEVEEEAFYILTPHMMEYIVQMDEKAKARTNLSFKRGGKLHIALNSGRDAFEVRGMQSNVGKIREQFVSEIRQVTDLIDELRITDSIFKN